MTEPVSSKRTESGSMKLDSETGEPVTHGVSSKPEIPQDYKWVYDEAKKCEFTGTQFTGLAIMQLIERIAKLQQENNKKDGRLIMAKAEADLDDAVIREFESTVAQLRAEVAMRDGTLNMAVVRLGGIVEGNPTGRHNFLQRIDELVAKEAELSRLKQPVSDEEWSKVYHTKPPANTENWFRWSLNELIASRSQNAPIVPENPNSDKHHIAAKANRSQGAKENKNDSSM